ncbi:fibronectin type III domain-containing protein [Halomontanus rarus]|uniref:fibronectin type III domain-containing protein n=1 Tax=Halomontanus rarus TaxID=3034020 RepID=UPI001A9A17F3
MLSIEMRTAVVTAVVALLMASATVAATAPGTNSSGGERVMETNTTDVKLTVSTAWADPTGDTDALLAANVTELNGTDTAWVWFEYRAEGADRWQRADGNETDEPGPVRGEARDLEPGTTYEYRALATDYNETTVVTGETETFTMPATATVDVRTEWADLLGETEMILGGNLTAIEGTDTASVWFEYRLEGVDEWTALESETRNETGRFTAEVDGLEPNATYEYRAVATDRYQSTIATGETKTFETLHRSPEIETEPVAAVDDSSAVLNATLRELGSADEVAVEFRYRKAGSTGWQWTNETIVAEPGTVTQHVDGLEADTTYEYVVGAFAGEYGDSVDLGDRRSFATDPAVSVTTDDVRNVDDGSATVYGSLENGDRDEATVAVEYRARGATAWERTDAALASDGTVSGTVTDLEAGTTYEFRVVADVGHAADAGDVRTATTDERPVVRTAQAAEIDDSTATVSASLTDLGGAASATVTFEYRAQGDDGWRSTDGQRLTEPGAVDAVVTDLESDTTYEYRAVATASDGYDAVGSVRTFTTETASQPPVVDELRADENSPPNPHADLSVDWRVTDADGDLEVVTVTVRDGAGGVVYTAETDVAGSATSGSEAFGVKHGAGDTYTVTVETTDADGETTTERTTVTA